MTDFVIWLISKQAWLQSSFGPHYTTPRVGVAFCTPFRRAAEEAALRYAGPDPWDECVIMPLHFALAFQHLREGIISPREPTRPQHPP